MAAEGVSWLIRQALQTEAIELEKRCWGRDAKLSQVDRTLRGTYSPQWMHVSVSLFTAQMINVPSLPFITRNSWEKLPRQMTQGNFVVWLHPKKEQTKKGKADSQAGSSTLRSNSPSCHSCIWEGWGGHGEVADTAVSAGRDHRGTRQTYMHTHVSTGLWALTSRKKMPGFHSECLNFSA